MSRVAFIAASGIGDGLLMMIGACQMRKTGDDVVLFHDRAPLLAPLFPDYRIMPFSDDSLDGFDLIYLQNDHSARAWRFLEKREAYPEVTVLFPKRSKARRLPRDIEFDQRKTFVDNMDGIFGGRDNGLHIEAVRENRVVIHPTSADPRKAYPKEKCLAVAQGVQKLGYEVVFTVSPEERLDWLDTGFELVTFPCLRELAAYLAASRGFIGTDSAIGHLASCVGTPTVTIASNPKQIALWRPGWTPGVVVTSRIPLPNFKGIGLRMREWLWHSCISPRRVTAALQRILGTHLQRD